MQDDITTRTIVQIYVSSTRYMINTKTIQTNCYVEGQYFWSAHVEGTMHANVIS